MFFSLSLLIELWDVCCTVCLFEYVLQLMDKDCYKDIEKIKTIGSTYMAAVGLVPTIGTKVELHFFFRFVLVCTYNRLYNKIKEYLRSAINVSCISPCRPKSQFMTI